MSEGAASSSISTATSPSPKSQGHEREIVTAIITLAVVIALGVLIFLYLNRTFNSNQAQPLEIRYYNGFEFSRTGTSWSTKWERDNLTYTLEFRHPPWEVENITVAGKTDDRFQRPLMFLTFDPPDELSRQNSFLFLASVDLTNALAVFDRDIFAACTQNATSACSNREIVTCSTNASVIYLKTSNETGIFLDGNCARIQGVEENLTKAADKAIYQWLRIIRE